MLSPEHPRKSGTRAPFRIVFTLITGLFLSAAPMKALAADPGALQLVGTIQSGHFAGAVFSDAKGEQTFLRIGEKLPDGSRIMAVTPEEIRLKGNDGASYVMYIRHDMVRSSATVQSDVQVQANPPAPPAINPNPVPTERQPIQRRPRTRSRSSDE